jgi:hypothetical protein
MTLQKLCIDSATRYLEYLHENNLGFTEIRVTQKQDLGGAAWCLRLSQRVVDIDTIQLRFRGNRYQAGDFDIDSYDDEKRVLILILRRDIPEFNEAAESEVLIISDMKFIVERLRNWFVARGDSIMSPEMIEGVVSAVPPIELNEDQVSAFSGTISAALCYVWGPPGTGKTKRVLSAAVMHQMLEGRRVAIIAPTNNAVEVAMRALIETASLLRERTDISAEQRVRLDLSRFLRVGSPTKAFADEYPSVCEARGLAKQIKDIEGVMEVLDKVIRFRKNSGALSNIELILALTNTVLDLAQRREHVWMRLGQLKPQISEDEEHLNSFWRRTFGTITRATPKVQERRERNQSEQRNLNEELAAIEKRIRPLSAEIKSTRTGSALLDSLYESFKSEASAPVAAFCVRLNGIADKTREELARRAALAGGYGHQTIEEIEAELRKQKDNAELLRQRTLEERLPNLGAVGMTLDAFIARFPDSVPFDHLFLDEAGYAPLIKSLPLLRNSVPVTLLGDHLQLPPVCEMKDQHFVLSDANLPVVLWAKPSLYLGKALDPETAVEDFPRWLWNYKLDAALPVIKTHTLGTTYRFGQNLAQILDAAIYQMGFRASSESERLKIRVIPVRRQQDGDWQNQWECEAIKKLMEAGIGNDFVVITPYRKQVSLLTRTLPFFVKEDVMTVNRAQGKEWDTVVFSAADTFQRPFLTDSSNPAGRAVLNTAVSRARKELILVCDPDYWGARGDAGQQLLCRLIVASNESSIGD